MHARDRHDIRLRDERSTRSGWGELCGREWKDNENERLPHYNLRKELLTVLSYDRYESERGMTMGKVKDKIIMHMDHKEHDLVRV